MALLYRNSYKPKFSCMLCNSARLDPGSLQLNLVREATLSLILAELYGLQLPSFGVLFNHLFFYHICMNFYMLMHNPQ